MAKNWWFKFDFKVWRTDSALRRCSLETRAFWLEVLCIMHETDEAALTGSPQELARLIGCESSEVMKCATELKQTGTADVTLGNGYVTLMSRRLKRELSVKEQTRLRVQKHRGNGDVTLQSKSKSNKKEIREEKRGAKAPAPLFEIFLGTVESALSKRLGISSLPNRREWHQKLAWAFENNFTAESVIECYDLLKLDEFWQTKSISAKTLTAQLPNLESLRRGAKQHKRTEKLPTTAEKLADAATNNAALILPPKPITIGAMQ